MDALPLNFETPASQPKVAENEDRRLGIITEAPAPSGASSGSGSISSGPSPADDAIQSNAVISAPPSQAAVDDIAEESDSELFVEAVEKKVAPAPPSIDLDDECGGSGIWGTSGAASRTGKRSLSWSNLVAKVAAIERKRLQDPYGLQRKAKTRRAKRFVFAEAPVGCLAALKDKLRAEQAKNAVATAAAAAEEQRLQHLVSNGGRMSLTVERGRGLVARDGDFLGHFGEGTADAYVRVLTGGRKEVGRTEVAPKTLNPEWAGATFEWEVRPREVRRGVVLAIFDADVLSVDDPMGRVTVWPSAE